MCGRLVCGCHVCGCNMCGCHMCGRLVCGCHVCGCHMCGRLVCGCHVCLVLRQNDVPCTPCSPTHQPLLFWATAFAQLQTPPSVIAQ